VHLRIKPMLKIEDNAWPVDGGRIRIRKRALSAIYVTTTTFAQACLTEHLASIKA